MNKQHFDVSIFRPSMALSNQDSPVSSDPSSTPLYKPICLNMKAKMSCTRNLPRCVTDDNICVVSSTLEKRAQENGVVQCISALVPQRARRALNHRWLQFRMIQRSGLRKIKSKMNLKICDVTLSMIKFRQNKQTSSVGISKKL